MKLIGMRTGLQTVIGRLWDDGTVIELAEATEFYADLDAWMGRATSPTGGRRHRDEIDEAPAVESAEQKHR